MMPDREKVINGLYDIGGFIAELVGFEQARNFLRTIDDTVALLKEQEVVSPLFVSGDGQFFCGACKFPLGVSGVNFCSGCGRKVKWT